MGFAASLAVPAAAGEEGGPGVYLEPAVFLEQAFGGDVPEPEVLWLTRSLRPRVQELLGHAPAMLRTRYWRRGERTAWILDEIGKEKPITTGIVIDGGRISRVTVLVFRESRGWQVRHPRFSRQLEGVELEGDSLNRRIDGITGATLSVRAVTNVARLALFLHRHVTRKTAGLERHGAPDGAAK